MVPKNVKRLIAPYPRHRKNDKILEVLGEDFYHDDLQDLHSEEDPAVAEEGGGVPYESSDEGVVDDEPEAHTAATVDDTNASIVEIEQSAST